MASGMKGDIDTDIFDAGLGKGEGEIEGGPDQHVGRRHQNISKAHVSTLA